MSIINNCIPLPPISPRPSTLPLCYFWSGISFSPSIPTTFCCWTIIVLVHATQLTLYVLLKYIIIYNIHTSLNSSLSSNVLLWCWWSVESWGFSTAKSYHLQIDTFTSSFPIWTSLISFSWLFDPNRTTTYLELI